MTVAIPDGDSVRVGAHIVTREGPITHVILHGDMSVEDTQQFLNQYQAMIDLQGFVLILMNVQDVRDMQRSARRVASEWGSRNGHCVRSAVYGASFVVRTMIELLNRAAGLFSGKAPEITFVATYEDGRDWLMAHVPLLADQINRQRAKMASRHE